MSNKQISDLTATASIGDDDSFVLDNNGAAKKLPGSVLKAWIAEDAEALVAPSINSADMAVQGANSAAQSASTAATAANAAKEACDDAVEALPTTVSDMFAALGLALIDGKLCVRVERDDE